LKELTIAQQNLIEMIFEDPVELPCFNSICRSHLSSFKESECNFCKQKHDLNVKPNETMAQAIAGDFYLTWKEKCQKKRIAELINETKTKIEKLKERESEIELFCFDHFAKLMNKVDLKKEQLKIEIDEIADELIDRLKVCKSTHEQSLKAISLENVLSMDEILKLESDLLKDSRKVEHIKEIFENLETKLDLFDMSLDQKMDGVTRVQNELDTCVIDLNSVKLNSEIFGKITLTISSSKSSNELKNEDVEESDLEDKDEQN